MADADWTNYPIVVEPLQNMFQETAIYPPIIATVILWQGAETVVEINSSEPVEYWS